LNYFNNSKKTFHRQIIFTMLATSVLILFCQTQARTENIELINTVMRVSKIIKNRLSEQFRTYEQRTDYITSRIATDQKWVSVTLDLQGGDEPSTYFSLVATKFKGYFVHTWNFKLHLDNYVILKDLHLFEVQPNSALQHESDPVWIRPMVHDLPESITRPCQSLSRVTSVQAKEALVEELEVMGERLQFFKGRKIMYMTYRPKEISNMIVDCYIWSGLKGSHKHSTMYDYMCVVLLRKTGYFIGRKNFFEILWSIEELTSQFLLMLDTACLYETQYTDAKFLE